MRKLLTGGACAAMCMALTMTPAEAFSVGQKSSHAGFDLVRDGGGQGGGRTSQGRADGGGANSGTSSGESGRSSSFDGGRRGGSDGISGNRSRGERGDRGGNRHADRRHRHRGGGGIGIYVDGGYYDRGSYGYGECAWLRRKAIRTGSGYWWRRYEDCID